MLVGTWAPWFVLLLIGFPPEMVFLQSGLNLLYQFSIHTEAIKRMPAWFEYLFNTPSHHRVHRASNPRYVDRNYAGIFMVWDRLFLRRARSVREALGFVFGLPGWRPDGLGPTAANIRAAWQASASPTTETSAA